MVLQFIDINNSEVTFANKEDNPDTKLQKENFELKLALAEMAESQEVQRLETQLALAELAEAMAGGVDIG